MFLYGPLLMPLSLPQPSNPEELKQQWDAAQLHDG